MKEYISEVVADHSFTSCCLIQAPGLFLTHQVRGGVDQGGKQRRRGLGPQHLLLASKAFMGLVTSQRG